MCPVIPDETRERHPKDGVKDVMAIKIVRKILELLSPSERRSLYLLFPAVIATGFLEVLGIASVAPFLALVGNPGAIQENRWLTLAYDTFGFSTPNQFLIFLGSGALVILTISNAFTALTTYHLTRFSYMRGYTLSRRLLIRYISQPYTFFLGRNTAHLGTSLLTEVQQVVIGIIVPGMKLVSKVIITLFIVGLLFLVDPVLALTVTLSLGVVYGTLVVLSRRKLRDIGKVRLVANRQRFKVAGEAFGGIKDLKLLGREQPFIDQFSASSKRYASTQATGRVISDLPRYALETIAFGGIVLIVIYLLASGQNIGQAFSLIGLYAFAAYRLMPALQQVFMGVTTIRFNVAALNSLYKDFRGDDPPTPPDRETLSALPFERDLALHNVSFAYPDTERPAVQNLSCKIGANTSVAFVGHTGSGKTTLIDVILGLLEPQSGTLTVDGTPLSKDNLANWQKSIGYVPQHIYLADDTIASNIAFGIPKKQLDLEAVERAAKIAHLHDFIAQDLPLGYDTVVGERGIRLSGGQRQRIGIARALYHDPSVLILDEATSALDGITEESVFAAVEALVGAKTIVMIAHRLSTVRGCDQIFLLEKGRITEQGSYDELLVQSDVFRTMARATTQSYDAAHS